MKFRFFPSELYNRLTLGMTPYGIASFAAFAWLYGRYFQGINAYSVTDIVSLYTIVSFILHFLFLAALAFLLVKGIRIACRNHPRVGITLIAVIASVSSLWLFVDGTVYALLKIHVNRFVVEAMLQKDAMNQIGLSPMALVSGLWPLLVVLMPHFFVGPLSSRTLLVIRGRTVGLVLICLSGLLLTDKLVYGYYYFKGAPVVFELRNASLFYPVPDSYYIIRFYETLLGKNSRVGFMEKLSNKMRAEAAGMNKDKMKFTYPTGSAADSLARQYNVIFVIAESLRAADFNEESAPFLKQLSGDEISAPLHFTSGNCTHFGVFSLLYGLNPFYFHDARMSKTPPISMQILNAAGYDIYSTISRTMQWYDLDAFAFGQKYISYEPAGEDSVERDRAVTKRAIDIALEHKASGKPYFNFIYYYATHADYRHPEESNKFKPEIKGRVDFTDSQLPKRRQELINRYRNSIYFLDGEIKRLVTELKQQGLWENTILVFTGDHGEEFFEEGKFGHNSSLNRYQTQVPLILHIPGEKARILQKITSHTDVMQTVISALGIPDATMKDFQGHDMLSRDNGPIYVGMAHYQRPEKFAVLTADGKVIVDMKNGYPHIDAVTDLDGRTRNIDKNSEAMVLGLLNQFRAYRK